MRGEIENKLNETYGACRHFVAYSGVKLPLKLVNPLEDSDMRNRNTFFRGYYGACGHLVVCQKIVYGEIELEHRYEYHSNGMLKLAVIHVPEEADRILRFDESGNRLD
jgi:hypothetical protein